MSSGRDKSRTPELVRVGRSLQPLGKNQAMKLMLEKSGNKNRDFRGLWISFCGYCSTAFSTVFSRGIYTDGK